MTRSKVGRVRERVLGLAERLGVEMRMPERIFNTRRALAVAERARDLGPLDAFRAAAMRAYWREGKDLEDEAALRDIAREAGLDPHDALAAADDPRYQERIDAVRAEAGRRGVSAIPTFFLGGWRIVGSQPYEVLHDAALRAGARPRRAR